jgi:serine/threonine protein kinase
MATGEEPRKSHSTDDQETSVLASGPATASGTLLNNRYLLIRQLSAGGFGTVHLAHDQQMHGRPVVVKIQINQRVDDPWFERKFSEEVRALSLLDHPGVVVAFDSGRTPDGMPFLVMQYVEGVTLRAVIGPEGMPLERAASILKQLGHALAAAHDKGIWHRDLKPENVMLQTSPEGEDRVRLIDFGIATVADAKSRYQTSTRIAGSALYMAPEQSIGQPTALTDIYAMGLIAYEMLTGRRPFPAENSMQMITMQQQPLRVRPSDLRPSVPPPAEQIIMQSLSAEPARRPQSARVFGDRLYDALLNRFHQNTALPPPPPPPPAFATAQPPVPAGRKRNAKWWGLAIGAFVIVTTTVRDWDKPPRHKTQPSSAQSQSAVSEDAIELAFWNSVKDSTEPRLYNEYLSKYSDGRFSSLARTKIEILTGKESPVPEAEKSVPMNLPANVPGLVEDLAFWKSVNESADPKQYETYLAKHPNGLFASVARLKIASLQKK